MLYFDENARTTKAQQLQMYNKIRRGDGKIMLWDPIAKGWLMSSEVGMILSQSAVDPYV